LFSGQSPAEADYNLLETARRCEMYGIKLTAVKDHEGVPLNLSVAHLGVIVFQNQTKVNTFSWAKIRKLSFKRKRFLIKLHQEVNHH
jgi:FERM/RhoGEF/pleckstrin domain protein 2